MNAACRMCLMCVVCVCAMALACCSGPCPPGTLARLERPVVCFDSHNKLAGYHVALEQHNKVMTVVFTNMQVQLVPCTKGPFTKVPRQTVSQTWLNFGVQSGLKEPFWGTVRMDFRYAAAFSKGSHGSIQAWLDGRRMVVLPDLTSSRHEVGIQSFELTRRFLPGQPVALALSLQAARTACTQAARLGLNSVDVQLLVPPRMARRLKPNTRT